MERTIAQIFGDLAQRGCDARLRDVLVSYRFDVEGVGSWRVVCDHGKLAVLEDAAPADCVIVCDAEDFVRIARGAQNLLTAYMQGRVRIEGDLALAKLLHGLLPPPPVGPSEGPRP